MIIRNTRRQPVSDTAKRLAEKGKSRLGVVQSVGPAAECGGIRHPIRIFECRRGLFPGAVFHNPPSQCLTARQQTVVGVRERKQWKKGEGPPATGAATPTNPDPVVMLVVRLLAAASMTDDGIAFTSGASTHDNFGATRSPLCFELVRRDGKWDKQNRRSSGLCPSGVDLPRSEPEAELLPPEAKIQLEENTASRFRFLRRDSQNWPVIKGNPEVIRCGL